MIGSRLEQLTLVREWSECPALLGTCLYGAVANSFLTDEEKGALEEIGATNEVERAGCAAALGLKTTLGMTQGEIVAAIRGVDGERTDGRVEVKNVESGREGLESAAGETRRGTVLGRSQWGIRGAWDDDYYQAFGTDWVFPFGTNHLAGVVVYSQGGLAVSSYDEPFVSLPIPVAIVPREGSFTVEQTSSNSTVFAWWNVRPGRTAAETLGAQIELFRNGDYCVSTNGVIVERYIRGNPYPDAPIGQDDDYRDWVDEQVGVGLENGLYKFTASFPVDPIEFTLLRVGEESVVVMNAGEYVFLLEKGREYEFETVPYDPTVEYDMCDDIAPSARMQLIGWWGDEAGVWTTDGGCRWLFPPSQLGYGTCFWEPIFRGAPDVANLTTADFPMTFTAMFFDLANTNGVAYHWFTEDENVYITSPYAQTTEVEIDTAFDSSTFSLTVEAIRDDRTYRSTLMTGCPTNVESGVSFSFPETMFVNNDDDNNDGVVDSDQRVVPSLASGSDDDLAVAEIGLPDGAAREGTLRFEGKDGFYGMVYDVTEKNASVGVSEEWEFSEGPAMSLPLEVSGWSVSEGYRSSELRFVWAPENGGEQTLIRRFTVVEPVVEPICSEQKTVIRNGEEHKIVYNPCGVGIGRDAYFKISLKPENYPDAKIVWSANGEGSVSFVGGNTGREVCVRGVSVGDVTLEIDIGGCSAARPTFPLKVVENVTVPIAVCILSNNGTLMREVADVYDMLPKVNDIYEQVGMSFYIESVVVTNVVEACEPTFGDSTMEDHWSFDKVANILPDSGGLKCYFIQNFVDERKTVGGHSPSGILLPKTADAVVWAHEIGHACGLDDIYNENNGQSVSVVEKFEWRHAIDDWNNGSCGDNTIGSRYYRKGLDRCEVNLRLLMYGYDATNTLDITTGCVDGIVNLDSSTSIPGAAKTGIFSTGGTRHPVHLRKTK